MKYVSKHWSVTEWDCFQRSANEYAYDNGIKMILKNSNLKTFLEFLIANFLNQLEVQNNITLKSFDLKNNYALNLYSNTFYYFEKSIKNLYFKSVLNYFNIVAIFNFVNNTDLFDHIFYLNFFKFYFNK